MLIIAALALVFVSSVAISSFAVMTVILVSRILGISHKIPDYLFMLISSVFTLAMLFMAFGTFGDLVETLRAMQ